MPHSPLANKTNKKPVLLEELGSRYGMITLEFGIKNTEKKKLNYIWFSTLAKNIALHCKF